MGFRLPFTLFRVRCWSFVFGLGRVRWFRFIFPLFGASRRCWFWPFASCAAVVSFVLNFGPRLVLVVRVALVLVLRVFTWFWSCAVVSFYFPSLFGASCWSTHTTK